MAIVIQQGMYFDAALGLPKRGPGKKRQAKLYDGGVQTEQFGLDFPLKFFQQYNLFYFLSILLCSSPLQYAPELEVNLKALIGFVLIRCGPAHSSTNSP